VVATQTFFMFHLIWGNDLILTSIFWRWVETNHQLEYLDKDHQDATCKHPDPNIRFGADKKLDAN